MRSPTDDGVDRPDLDAPQGVKATGTNRPKQTHTLPFVSVSTTKHDNEFTVARVHYTVSDTTPATKVCPVCLSVAYSSRETPGPIPNPEAKPANADGTATGRLWESKKPPTPNNKQTTQYNQERPLKHNRFNGLFLRFSIRITLLYRGRHQNLDLFGILLKERSNPFLLMDWRI